jgi:hypothetical protein
MRRTRPAVDPEAVWQAFAAAHRAAPPPVDLPSA